MRRCPDTPHPRRAGLTLIELLVVILIIGILMSLLIPAVGVAFRRAKEAQVTAEINNLSTALADFKNKFGDYPPSRLYCAENGDYSVPTAALPGLTLADSKQLVLRSAGYIRKFWPRVQISTTGAVYTAYPNCLNFNGNTAMDNYYILQGPECLVFFLGGIPQATVTPSKTTYAMTGFGRNPVNPFVAVSPTGAVDNRVIPLYEFNNGRLDDSDGNGVPCYLDPLGGGADNQPIADTNDKRPYAYFCSYGNGSYDPDDYNANETDDTTGSKLSRQFYVNYLSTLVSSSGPNPYTVSGPVGGTSTAKTSATFQNAQSFQILSAGADRKWGIGGMFSNTGSQRLPFDTAATATGPTFYDTYITATPTVTITGDPRVVERDNLTNFSAGRLD